MFDFKFDWQPSMATGIEIVDVQHQQLLKMGRDVEQMVQNGCVGVTEEQMLEFVVNLRNYIGYHLYTEESLMEECQYPKIAEHREYHQNVVRMVLKYSVRELLADSGQKLKELRTVFQEILFGHMLIEDVEFANYYLAYVKGKKDIVQTEKAKEIVKQDKYGSIIKVFDASSAYLSHDQTYKGHVLVVYKEKRNRLTALTVLERNMFFADVARVASAVTKAVSPDALEYAYYEDIDDRLLMHIVPKFSKDKDFHKAFQIDNFHEICKDESFQELVLRIRKELT